MKSERGTESIPGLEEQVERLAEKQAELRTKLERCTRSMQGLGLGTQDLASIEELRAMFRELQEQIREVDERCAAATELAAINHARMQELLESRTWRILTQSGGFLRRILGR